MTHAVDAPHKSRKCLLSFHQFRPNIACARISLTEGGDSERSLLSSIQGSRSVPVQTLDSPGGGTRWKRTLNEVGKDNLEAIVRESKTCVIDTQAGR